MSQTQGGTQGEGGRSTYRAPGAMHLSKSRKKPEQKPPGRGKKSVGEGGKGNERKIRRGRRFWLNLQSRVAGTSACWVLRSEWRLPQNHKYPPSSTLCTMSSGHVDSHERRFDYMRDYIHFIYNSYSIYPNAANAINLIHKPTATACHTMWSVQSSPTFLRHRWFGPYPDRPRST